MDPAHARRRLTRPSARPRRPSAWPPSPPSRSRDRALRADRDRDRRRRGHRTRPSSRPSSATRTCCPSPAPADGDRHGRAVLRRSGRRAAARLPRRPPRRGSFSTGSPVIDLTGIPVTVLKAYKTRRRIIQRYSPKLPPDDGPARRDRPSRVRPRVRRLRRQAGPDADADPRSAARRPPGRQGDLRQRRAGSTTDDQVDRAVGPMQFIPSTWVLWAADGNPDKVGDPNNVYDAALAGLVPLPRRRRPDRPEGLQSAVLRYDGLEATTRHQGLDPGVPEGPEPGPGREGRLGGAAPRRAAAAEKAAASREGRGRGPAARGCAAGSAAGWARACASRPALEPVADGRRPSRDRDREGGAPRPDRPRAPQPAPAGPAAAGRAGRRADQAGRRRVRAVDGRAPGPEAGGGRRSGGDTLSGLSRPKGGGSAPPLPRRTARPARSHRPRPTPDDARPPPTGFPLG